MGVLTSDEPGSWPCAFGGAFVPSACLRCELRKSHLQSTGAVALGPVQISPPLNTGPVRGVKGLKAQAQALDMRLIAVHFAFWSYSL